MVQHLFHPGRARVFGLAAAAACAGLLTATVMAAPQAAPVARKDSPYRIWQGVFTQAQTLRGKHTFEARCAHCHLEDLSGGDGPGLVGGNFWRGWGSRYVDRLFKKVKEKMPPGEEFLVSDAEKLDIITYILAS